MYMYYLLYWPEEDPPGSKRCQNDYDEVCAAEDYYYIRKNNI